MKKTRTLLLAGVIASLFLTGAGCARFKVDKMTLSVLFSIPLGNELHELNYPRQRGLYYEIPSRVAVVGDWLAISEASSRVIKIYKENQLSGIIYSSESTQKKPEKPEKVGAPWVVESAHLGVPGMLVSGHNDDFYAVTYTPPVSGDAGGAGYYKIVHFDIKGNFVNLIGRNNKESLPFERIIWMDIDENRNLWVLYRYLGNLYLDRIGKESKVLTISEEECRKTLFGANPQDEKRLYSCEVMLPFEDGENILYSGKVQTVPRESEESLEGYEFLYRTYKVKSSLSGEVKTVFEKHRDPDSYPELPIGDQIYIWKPDDGNRVRAAIYNLEGDLLNNLQIEFTGKKNNWRSTYPSLSGEIYSLRIHQNNLEVCRWK